MTEKNKILEDINNYYSYCSAKYNERDGDQLSERLKMLAAMLARVNYIQGDAQFYRDIERGEVADKNTEVNATRLREILAKETATTERLVFHCNRLESTIKHQIDAIRTQLSYLKSLPS